jgi:hypothetical protein
MGEIFPFGTGAILGKGIAFVSVFRLGTYATFLVCLYDAIGLPLHNLSEALRLLQR